MSLPKMQKHWPPVKCYREVYKYHADHITEKVNESFQLSEHIVWSLLGYFSSIHCPGQGYFLQALPISFLKLFLSHRSSSEAAACPSTRQWPSALLPPSFLLQIDLSCLSCFVWALFSYCRADDSTILQNISILRKKQQCFSPCPVRHFQHTSCCSADVTMSPASC